MDLVYQQSRSKIHPKLFGLIVACASIVMMFVALTSAYLVRQAAGNWLEYPIPQIFYGSTIILLASSLTLHLSYRSYVRGKESPYKRYLIATLLLGILFLICQYLGWIELISNGVMLDGNPAGSFFYVISGLHAAHIIGGITSLIIAIGHAFGLKFKVTGERKLRFSLVLLYWHFVDFLWLYLLLFLIIQQ